MTLFDINKAEAASKAVELYRDQRPSPDSPKLTLRQCADKCNAHYSLVRKYNARYQKGQRIPGFQKPGRQPALDDQEEEALGHFVKLLRRGLFPLTSAALISYGDFLRSRRPVPPSSMPLTYRWAIKWKRDNPHFGGRGAGTDLEGVEEWFGEYGALLSSYGVRGEDLWSFDETPFLVGRIEGEVRVLIVRNKKKRARVVFAPGEREGLKVVDCVSALGGKIPCFLVLRGDILADDDDGDDDDGDTNGFGEGRVIVRKNDTRYYNAENALDWIRHFNTHSFEMSPSFHGSIEDWFGYPASINPSDGDPRPGSGRARTSPTIYRVLVMDGFDAHEKPAILLYCSYFDIFAVSLPSHTSTRFQPFDVGLYRWLKAAQRGTMQKAMTQQQDGAAGAPAKFALRDIVAEWTRMHAEIFTGAQIRDAFKSAGLWPVDAAAVTSQIKDQIRLRLRREIPDFKVVEGSFYLASAGRADTLVTDPILEARLAMALRWRSCRTDEERTDAIALSAGAITEIPEVEDWIRKRSPGAGLGTAQVGSAEDDAEGDTDASALPVAEAQDGSCSRAE